MIPLPLSDENPTRRPAYVVKAIVIACALVWIGELLRGVTLTTLEFGLIPSWLVGRLEEGRLALQGGDVVRLHQGVPWPLTLFTSMFVHGSWAHIIGNCWFLWIFGDNIEDEMGPLRFIVFYLVCGAAAALAQVLSAPGSTIPMVGASGAIAGVMGAYLVQHPHARVRCLWILIIFITFVRLPAWLLLAIWFVSQFLIPQGAGVAVMAHVGGFVAGLVLVKPFLIGRDKLRR